MPSGPEARPEAASPLDRARRKAYLRIVPLMFAGFVIAFIDRANIAIAKLTMAEDLPAFDNAVIGVGASMFFVGYVLLEIPGTLLVERWSARKWLGRIMISWGLVAALQAFVKTPGQFYLVRFLLGLAEAGFLPGVIVYFTHWFPARDRARATALLLVGTPVAQLINPKISGALLEIGRGGTPPLLGMVGWQWVFVAWALPAVVLGVVTVLVLPDRPRHARWLTADEREALEAELRRERIAREQRHGHFSLGAALRAPRVLLLSIAYMFAVAAFYGIDFFVPSILARWYAMPIGTLTTWLLLPAAASMVAQLVFGWSSDRTGERRFHTAVPLAVAAICLALAPLARGSFAVAMLLFTLATVGMKAYLPSFWCIPSTFLTGVAAAGTTGFVNSVGNLGGILGSYSMGKLEAVTGSFEGGLYVTAAAAALAAAGTWVVSRAAR